LPERLQSVWPQIEDISLLHCPFLDNSLDYVVVKLVDFLNIELGRLMDLAPLLVRQLTEEGLENAYSLFGFA